MIFACIFQRSLDMLRVHGFGRAGVLVLLIIATLSMSALGCGLIGGPEPEPAPTPEPYIGATVAAAMSSITATREAAAPADSAAPPPAASPAKTETPALTPAATNAGSQDLATTLADAGPDSTWGSLFDAFTEAERSCIAAELGEERLSQVMDTPIFGSVPVAGWEPMVFGCLEQETAAALFLTMLSAQTGPAAGLSEPDNTCIRGLLADTDIASLVAASGPEATPAQAEVMFAFLTGMAVCVPELMADGPGGPPQTDAGSDETRLWRFTTGGWVDTAPVVADGVVYVGSADGRVYALDAADGSERWSFATGDAVKSTPTVFDGIVYVGSNDNHVYALDAATGAELWSRDTGARVQYSPPVAGGLVYVSALSDGDRKVHAIDAGSGETVWVDALPHHWFDGFAPVVVGGRVYVPRANFGGYHALDAATGETVWTTDMPDIVESPPTVVDGVVYVTSINHAYALDDATGSVIWSYDTEWFPAREFPARVIHGVYYLSPDDRIHALDVQDGKEIWSYRASSFLSTAPVVSDGALFAATEAGEVFALDAQTGAPLWAVPEDGMGLQGLTVVDGVLYLESDSGNLIAIDAADGRTIWKVQKGYVWGARTYTVSDDMLYYGSLDGSVNAHSAPVP